jgi:hypothetical protein
MNTYQQPIYRPQASQERPDIRQRAIHNLAAPWLSGLLAGLMVATTVVLFWFPIRRALAFEPISFNEGWNAYKQAMAARGIPLYGALSQHFTGSTGYTPLSFHLVAWLGRPDHFTETGRAISLLSLLAAGILLGLIVRRASGRAFAGLFSFLLYEIGIVLLFPSHVGMNDPQFLGEALAAAGLYFYVRATMPAGVGGGICARWLGLSALAFGLAGFTKQTFIALPATVGLDLLLRSRKSFALWAAALLACGGLFTALTFFIDGRYFFANLSSSRAYLYANLVKNVHTYLTAFQAPLLVAVFWSFYIWRTRALRSRGVFVTALLLTHLVAVLLAGGDGVDVNILFGAWFVTVIACGLALVDLAHAAPALRTIAPHLNFSLALMFWLFLSVLINVPRDSYRDFRRFGAIGADEKDFRSAVRFLQARAGPALCESPLLCFDAGKPYDFDPYYVKDQLSIGRLREDDIVQKLKTHYFKTVQLMQVDGEPIQLSDPKRDPYLTPNLMTQLLDNYRVAMTTATMLVLVPTGSTTLARQAQLP